MTSLWFVMPAHGRLPLAQICMRQLRRTCDSLTENGVDATAVVIADDDNLACARSLGFATVRRDNRFVSRKFNDGLQLACDPAFNPRPADYAVPIGSDDWVDWRLFTDLPGTNAIHGFQRISFVREDGREITSRFLDYPGGCGIRVFPRQVLAAADYRPAEEDRSRGCDTSILVNLRRILGDALRIWHMPSDVRQIVDWKTSGEQITPYDALTIHQPVLTGDPFVELAEFFPGDALDEMRAHYGLDRQAVAA